jgi:predicted ATPase
MVTLAVENYRSLRNLAIPLTELNVVTGANGSGKSSLYRALRLLGDASRNGAVAALAREGGLPSTLWAGPDKAQTNTGSVGLRLGFAGTDFGYAIDLGPPGGAMGHPDSMFRLDPEIKRESVWSGPVLRPASALTERHNGAVTVRDAKGKWAARPHPIRPYDSMLSEFADPETAPELFRVRERIRSWRFYDHFRTDAGAPARASHIGTRTPVLAHDGADLAAALRTIFEIGDRAAMDEAIDQAFPGSGVAVENFNGYFGVLLHQPGLFRPLGAAELSDGTLRYLLLVAALLTPRPPELLVLNEPETSLHPELLAPLGSLIAAASKHSQIIVVSHAQELIAAIGRGARARRTDVTTVELVKESGATVVRGQGLLDGPPWHWPKR